MKTALVGYTGFVGSNIYAAGNFDAAYNSGNIEEAYGTEPELLIFAGLRAEKYLANSNPDKDMALIEQAEENIKRIRPHKLVLISSVDVFKNPVNVDEMTEIDTEGLQPYGFNRYLFECWARENFPDALIVRLPALFGKNIKKNFIYDFINVIPFMLKKEKFIELSEKDPGLKRFYLLQDNGFYKVNVSDEDKEELKNRFKALNFSALNFTDSRSKYQFYNLGRLWGDIQIALQNDIHLQHMATEPISAGELFTYLTGGEFVNNISDNPANYDFRTVNEDVYSGNSGYISDKSSILESIREYVYGNNT